MRIRTFEPGSRQIREVTLVQKFRTNRGQREVGEIDCLAVRRLVTAWRLWAASKAAERRKRRLVAVEEGCIRTAEPRYCSGVPVRKLAAIGTSCQSARFLAASLPLPGGMFNGIPQTSFLLRLPTSTDDPNSRIIRAPVVRAW